MEAEDADIRDPRHAAAGDHRHVGGAREIDGRIDIHALEQAVAADIGEEQAGDARILEPAGEVDHRHVALFRPAVGGDEAVARIDRDDDAAGEVARGRLDEGGVFQRSGADHDARYAQVKPAFDRFPVADAAAELDMAGKGLDDAFDRFGIDRMTGKAAIQIDDMDMLGAGRGKDQRLRGGIVAIDGGTVHVALGQADDLAAFEVDGGEDDQGHYPISVRFELVENPRATVLDRLEPNGGRGGITASSPESARGRTGRSAGSFPGGTGSR